MVETIVVVLGNLLLPYLILSVIAMLLVELISATLGLRGRILKRFIYGMFSEHPGSGGIADQIYSHQLVSSLAGRDRLPAYIPTSLFAIVLLDALETRPEDARNQQIPTKTRVSLTIDRIIRYASGDLARAVKVWYVATMDGASGRYRLITLMMALAVAACMVAPVNFDALRISDHVSKQGIADKILEVQVKVASEKADKNGPAPDFNAAFQQSKFPLGWAGDRPERKEDVMQWTLMKIVGLLTSILAIGLVSSFWFDILNRWGVVRSTIKPFEGGFEELPTPGPQFTVATAADASTSESE